MEELILSQWVLDLIGTCGFFLIWLPLILSVVGLIVLCVVLECKSAQLKQDYELKMSDNDLRVIREYKENTNYIRYKRRLRRIKKNLNTNK